MLQNPNWAQCIGACHGKDHRRSGDNARVQPGKEHFKLHQEQQVLHVPLQDISKEGTQGQGVDTRIRRAQAWVAYMGFLLFQGR